ncbi:MAG: hypothetical protein Q9220_005680 [cf. Caloplaca sp. 1 TL-2023]
MPPLSDKNSRHPQQQSSPNTHLEESTPEGRSSGPKSKKKKHDRNTENTINEGISKSFPKELTSSPSLLSQYRRVSPPPIPPSNDTTSPLLTALGQYPIVDDYDQRLYAEEEWVDRTLRWGSPPRHQSNGFDYAASPPRARQPAKEFLGGFNSVSPGPSPPTTYAQPVRRTSGYQSLGGYRGSSPSRERPISRRSQQSPMPNPPLPHHPQAHFYSAPEIDFGKIQTRPKDERPPAHGCCAFDNLNSAGAEGFRGAESVLLLGSGNALDILSVDKGRLDRIGRLENLRGSVVGAQLLPSQARSDPFRSLRPLVAVILYGPSDGQPPGSGQSMEDPSDNALFDPSASMMEALEDTKRLDSDHPASYQTTVEVYSLAKSEYVTTLLKISPAATTVLQSASQSAIPPSEDHLRLQACGRFLVVSSHKSGEVFIFEMGCNAKDRSSLTFGCIGKTWTSIPQKSSRSLSMSSAESGKVEPEDGPGHTTTSRSRATFSLSQRWLAIVPPSNPTKTTVHASVDLRHSHHRPPGLYSHTSPQSPSTTCELDDSGQESLINKVARDVTQEFIKGARWVGDQGLRAWNNYWQKPSDPDVQTTPRSLPTDTDMPPYTHKPLPPTHAYDDVSSRTMNQKAIVAILDLEKLSASQSAKEDVALQPVAAFALTDGCSLLSFTPNGLALLTASAKGDVQHVWSLMQMTYGGSVWHTDHSQTEKGPNIRQVARFTRLTVAKIIDVVWTDPLGERLALVTERGTVHIYDLPASAFQWPPPRRIARPSSTTPQAPNISPELEGTMPQNAKSNRFGSAMDMVTGRTQPLFAAVRGRPASIGNPFSGFSGMSLTAGAGIKSGKVVTAGFNRSIGAATGTVNTIRHLGENRLSLPGPAHTVGPGRVRWLAGRNRGYIAVSGGDTVRVHRIGRSTYQKPGKRRPSVVRSKPVEVNISCAAGTAAGKQGNSLRDGQQQADPSILPSGFWQAPPPHGLRQVEEDSLHSQAEIETNAPYQPFHTDRRINLHVYSDEQTSMDPHHLENSTPWVFGEAISTTRIRAGAASSDDGDDVDLQQPGVMENHVSVQGNADEGQQIVVTTRRRKVQKANAGEGDGEEIFEDDCEVVDFADERV